MAYAASIDQLSRSAAVGAIVAYQRYISPYKGFRCAHNVLHRQGSCSGFGRKAFAEHPIPTAWRMLQGRFAECRAALATLTTAHEEEEQRRKRQSSSSSGWDDCGIGDALVCGALTELAVCDCG